MLIQVCKYCLDGRIGGILEEESLIVIEPCLIVDLSVLFIFAKLGIY